LNEAFQRLLLKVLAKELKDLEENQLIKRIVHVGYPELHVEYTVTDYAMTLGKVNNELKDWGLNHRTRIIGK